MAVSGSVHGPRTHRGLARPPGLRPAAKNQVGQLTHTHTPTYTHIQRRGKGREVCFAYAIPASMCISECTTQDEKLLLAARCARRQHRDTAGTAATASKCVNPERHADAIRIRIHAARRTHSAVRHAPLLPRRKRVCFIFFFFFLELIFCWFHGSRFSLLQMRRSATACT